MHQKVCTSNASGLRSSPKRSARSEFPPFDVCGLAPTRGASTLALAGNARTDFLPFGACERHLPRTYCSHGIRGKNASRLAAFLRSVDPKILPLCAREAQKQNSCPLATDADPRVMALCANGKRASNKGQGTSTTQLRSAKTRWSGCQQLQ